MENEFIHSGLISFMDDNFHSAIDLFSKLIDKNQSSFDAYLFRGRSYFQIGNYILAINDFNNAEKLKDNDYDLIYSRAKAHFYNLDFKSANEDLKRIENFTDLSEERKENLKLLKQKLS